MFSKSILKTVLKEIYHIMYIHICQHELIVLIVHNLNYLLYAYQYLVETQDFDASYELNICL